MSTSHVFSRPTSVSSDGVVSISDRGLITATSCTFVQLNDAFSQQYGQQFDSSYIMGEVNFSANNSLGVRSVTAGVADASTTYRYGGPDGASTDYAVSQNNMRICSGGTTVTFFKLSIDRVLREYNRQLLCESINSNNLHNQTMFCSSANFFLLDGLRFIAVNSGTMTISLQVYPFFS